MEYLANVTTADVLYEQLLSSLKLLSTGCQNLDDILGGGLYCGELTEVFGSPGLGKTQSCLSIACHVAGTLDKNVVYIDTTAAFSSKRIHEILMERCGDTNKTMNSMTRIQCIKTFEIFHALFVLEELAKCLSKEEDAFYQDVVLVIFDSVASIISPVLGGAKIKGFGHGMMVRFSRLLKALACDHNVAILFTNNVVSDSNNSYTKPALGVTWSHVPNTRIFLHQGEQEPSKTFVKTTKSVKMPLQDSRPVIIDKTGLH